jgi:hypothetical protein
MRGLDTTLESLNVPCTTVNLLLKRGRRGEIWIKCSSIGSFYETLELLLSQGLLIEKVGFLNGIVLDSGLIGERGLEDLLAVDLAIEPGSTIVAVYYRSESALRLIESLYPARSIEKASVNLRRRIITAKIVRQVPVSLFFDVGVRLLSPFEIPPRLNIHD